MALIGDGHRKSFNMVEDIHKITSRMEQKVNLRVMGKEGETLSRMYDEQRESLISPLPTRCYKVAISIGTYDLKDNSLITLKEASMRKVHVMSSGVRALSTTACMFARLLNTDQCRNSPWS